VSGARDRQRAEQRHTARAAVTAALRATLPALSDDDISPALAIAKADKGIPLNELAMHLSACPNALTSGDPRCPWAVVRLAHTLHAAGHTAVVRPGCAGCGKVGDLPRSGPAGRICQMCAVRANLAACARCGRESTRIAARRGEGGICYSCYRTDTEVIEQCGRCGRGRMPVTRLDDGTALCKLCWTPPVRRCDLCGRDLPATINGPDEVVCEDCYRRHRQPRRRCGHCGRVRPVAKRAAGGAPDLCNACNLGPEMVCSVCGRTRPCRRHGPDRAWYCHSCKPRAIEQCCGCGRDKPVHARWPIGPLCTTCHNRLLDSPADCTRCAQFRVLVARDRNGSSICGPCAGVDLDPRCDSCRYPGRHYSPGRCARCALDQRLHDLLSGPDGEMTRQLEPVHRALSAAQNPRGVILWTRRSPNARLLAQLAATGEPLTHEMLDGLPPGRHEFYIRQLLVTTGVLPERHDDLERLPSWLDQTLATAPGEHARLLRPFTHWFLLRRARRRASTRRQPAVASGYLRTRILTALSLLTWLDERRMSLAQLDQPTLDAWLAAGNVSSYTIRYFLGWAHSRGLAGELVVPALPRHDPERMLDDAKRWDLLRRSLTDQTLALDIRAAAALVLLFGLPVSRIRHLTTDQLDIGADRSVLRTGHHPLLLPPKLAALLKRLAAAPHTRSRIAGGQNTTRWLFPGLTPGRPASQSSFQVKLRDLGIAARPARNAALIALADDLPVPVLADVLGLSLTTAQRWAALAQRDWAAYIAERVTAISPEDGQELGTTE
jgi:hypothetical protein